MRLSDSQPYAQIAFSIAGLDRCCLRSGLEYENHRAGPNGRRTKRPHSETKGAHKFTSLVRNNGYRYKTATEIPELVIFL